MNIVKVIISFSNILELLLFLHDNAKCLSKRKGIEHFFFLHCFTI
jgi:hypothetical protein